MQKLNRTTAGVNTDRPVKILQFGTGNFLRGFTDWIVDLLNEKAQFSADIQLVQVHGKRPASEIANQEGLFHVITRGFQQGQTIDESRLITCVRGATNPYLDYAGFLALGTNPDLTWIVSNTTEAGIFVDPSDRDPDQTPHSFPGKLTALLYHRFTAGDELLNHDLHVLPCELIEGNGEKLKSCVLEYAALWKLPEAFTAWHEEWVHYYNTLVDRIVPGYPSDEAAEIQQRLGFQDDLMVVAEPFHFWAIEGPESLKEAFPAEKIGLNVLVVPDLTPYRKRKVRILNGAHTTFVPLAYLQGLRIVKEAVDDATMGSFLKGALYEEIIPSMDMAPEELIPFAEAVMDRFKNPFIRHQLSAIALNSISKFRVRVLPSLLGYIRKKEALPGRLVRSFAALMVFYRGRYKGETLPVNDTEEVMAFISDAWSSDDPYETVPTILANLSFWGQDLNQYPGLSDAVIQEVKALLGEELVRRA
ncbi:MAG: tagaturonate reductase [Lunatimonas sp.]|uniref:tagaturonate reductase n=1 Tax=Lunatimonas sp. TaxID=2060141 RepID=UPI00263A975C|nr:tagaturonate reductase [Lunatimonas sp.]MCC5936478.1 tagaturonate reductase [Lunatimonas sp.]